MVRRRSRPRGHADSKKRQETLAAEIVKREQLYAEFISQCAKLAVDALDHTLDDAAKLFEVYALQHGPSIGS